MSRRIDSHRVSTVVRRIFNQIRRDRRTLGLMIIAPIVVTVLFAFMFAGSITNVPTAVCIQDQPLESSLGFVVSSILDENVNVTVFHRNHSDAFNDLGSSIQAVLLLPSNLTRSIVTGKNTTIEVFVNTTSELQANYILTSIANMTSEASIEMFGRKGIQFESNVTFEFPLPPMGGSLSFNLSLVDEDEGFPDSVGAIYSELLSENGNVSIITCPNREAVVDSITREEAVAGVHVSSDFTRSTLRGETPTIELFVNGVESTEAATALATLQEALSDALAQVLERSTGANLTYIYGEAGMSMIEIAGPSMIGFLSVFFGFLIPGVFFLRERQQGTLERMHASPLTDFEIVLGYVIAFIGVSLIQTTLVSVVIVYFSPTLLSSILLMIPLVLLLATGSVTLAIAVSYRMKNELQVMQMIPLFIIPQMFLSGLLFPLTMLPAYLAFLPYIFPLTYFVMAVKALVFFKATFLEVAVPLMILLFYCLLGIFLSIAKRSEG
jgi:ABC-2 type transport system permease protein